MRQTVYKEIERCKWLEERKVPSMDTLEKTQKGKEKN